MKLLHLLNYLNNLIKKHNKYKVLNRIIRNKINGK